MASMAATQAQLIPSLWALLPADQLDLMLSRLSLHAIHAEPHHIRDDIFLATHPITPGVHRALRVRARRRRRGKRAPPAVGGDGKPVPGPPGVEWDYNLAWISPPLSGQEYANMRVQAYVGLDVAGLSTREDVEEFVVALGFKHSHSTERVGHLFHLPIPGSSSMLHLTVTRVLVPPAPAAGPAPTTAAQLSEHAGEPYLVQLQPAKPVNPVPQPRSGEPSLQDMMRIIGDVGTRIDGLEWVSGRETRAVA